MDCQMSGNHSKSIIINCLYHYNSLIYCYRLRLKLLLMTNNYSTGTVSLAVEKALQLPKMTLELKSDGIVYCTYHHNAVVFRHDVEEGVHKRIELFGDQSRFFIVNLDRLKGISSDARRYFTSKKGSYNIKGVAFVVSSETVRNMALNYLQDNEMNYPVSFFETEELAKNWLMEQD